MTRVAIPASSRQVAWKRVDPLARLVGELGDLVLGDDRVGERVREDVAVAAAEAAVLVLRAFGEEVEVAEAEPVGRAEQEPGEREVVAWVVEHAQPGDDVEDLRARPEAAERVDFDREPRR